MDTKDIRKMSDEQLTAELAAARRRLFDLRTQQVVGEKVTDTAQFPKIRKNVARLLTESTARRSTK
ncbi:MAG: 50S ribosomal protein L29 [Planctomycetota bacterium]|nr:50S ribosomal protein L29 [Planctomycetota bacterium]MDA1105254.1 50S ribosomal protein L29 [Planctomycetota bacterium]